MVICISTKEIIPTPRAWRVCATPRAISLLEEICSRIQILHRFGIWWDRSANAFVGYKSALGHNEQTADERGPIKSLMTRKILTMMRKFRVILRGENSRPAPAKAGWLNKWAAIWALKAQIWVQIGLSTRTKMVIHSALCKIAGAVICYLLLTWTIVHTYILCARTCYPKA
jgi:hypothetical protein